MADTARTKDDAATEDKPPTSAPAKSDQTNLPEPSVERYDRDGWKERARTRFNVSPHAIAGALHDVGDDLLSEQEVQARLDDFMRLEVKP